MYPAGSWCFSHLDDMSFADAFYLTTVSVTTVGYGDLFPSSARSKLFACIYVPVAVMFTGLAIDSIAAAHTKRRVRQLEEHVIGQFAGGLTDVYEYQELKRQTAVRNPSTHI
eukprot:COSAG02_NODE_90_length_37755_cov_29.833364_30_plen_112_part_00